MAGSAKSLSAKRSSDRSSTARPHPIGAPSKLSSTFCAISKARLSRLQMSPPLSPWPTKRSSSSSRLGSCAKKERSMSEDLTFAEYAFVLREDFATFVARCFPDLNPQAKLAMNCHLEVIAAKLMAVRQGKIRRLIINLPPRHLKSLMASIAFPAWCLGHDPSAQILCVSYAQDLADKFARDCRSIMMAPWYQRI